MKIALIVVDCDGVLTDGKVWFSENLQQSFKCYSFQDIMGLNMAQRSGVLVAIISGEKVSKSIVKKLDLRKQEKRVRHAPIVKSQCRNKAGVLKSILKKYQISAKNTIYIGDDINDIPAIRMVGIGVAVRNAPKQVKAVARLVTTRDGGNGAVREIIEKFKTKFTRKV